MNPRILMIGGDNTSDRFGAALASKIHELCPQATVYGVGGPLMNDAGVRLLSDISEIVSLGVLQSMRGSTVIKRLIARVVETMDQEGTCAGPADRPARLRPQDLGNCQDPGHSSPLLLHAFQPRIDTC